MDLEQLALDDLRLAVRNNQVSFPAQVPAFPKLARPDLQWQMVQLYFIRGWSSESIGNRYGLTRERVRQILVQWKHRALFVGLIQYIPPAEPVAAMPLYGLAVPAGAASAAVAHA